MTYPKDLGPSNWRVWTYIAGVRSSKWPVLRVQWSLGYFILTITYRCSCRSLGCWNKNIKTRWRRRKGQNCRWYINLHPKTGRIALRSVGDPLSFPLSCWPPVRSFFFLRHCLQKEQAASLLIFALSCWCMIWTFQLFCCHFCLVFLQRLVVLSLFCADPTPKSMNPNPKITGQASIGQWPWRWIHQTWGLNRGKPMKTGSWEWEMPIVFVDTVYLHVCVCMNIHVQRVNPKETG